MEFFQVREFCVYLGKFKKDWKINGYRNSLHKIYLFCLRGLDLFSGKIIHVQTVYLPSNLELLLTRRNLLILSGLCLAELTYISLF